MFFDRFKATARKNAEKEAALKATVSKTNTLDCHGRKSENALPSSVGHTSSSALDTTYPEHIAHDGSQNVTPCSYWNKQDHNQQYASSQQDPETMEGEIPFNLIRTPPHELECKIQNLESQIRVLQQEQKDMEDDHRGEKIRLQEKFSQLRLRHEEQKWQLTQRTDEVTRLTTEVSTLRNQHQSESIASEKTFKQELDMMARSHESMEESIRQDFELKREQFAHQAERDVTHLKAQHSKTLIALKKRHTEETAKLRKDVDAFSQALLQRDKFEAMSDKEMKARFSDLAQDVETLARGKWRPENSKWTPEVLQNLSTNQRVLGKHIIHDCIWMILNEHLFVSPFRILEAEGRVLEKQWLRDCGSSEGPAQETDGYTWPHPAVATERWRYSTLKECQEALKKPTSEWDARARLKESFQDAMDALRTQLSETLNDLIVMDNASISSLKKMTNKAANMWLAFGTQRCRVLLVLEGSNVKHFEEKIRAAREGVLELVVEPKLTRFGNSKGQELDSAEVIGGCDGQIVKIRWSSQGRNL